MNSGIAERASSSLYEDERLRSNLTDEQADIVLKWADDWLSSRIAEAPDEAAAQQIAQTEGKRARTALAAINALAENEAFTLAQAVAALEPILTGGRPFSREEVLILLTGLAGAAWDARE